MECHALVVDDSPIIPTQRSILKFIAFLEFDVETSDRPDRL